LKQKGGVTAQRGIVLDAVRDGLVHIELNGPGASNAVDVITAQALEEVIGMGEADT